MVVIVVLVADVVGVDVVTSDVVTVVDVVVCEDVAVEVVVIDDVAVVVVLCEDVADVVDVADVGLVVLGVVVGVVSKNGNMRGQHGTGRPAATQAQRERIGDDVIHKVAYDFMADRVVPADPAHVYHNVLVVGHVSVKSPWAAGTFERRIDSQH